MDIGALVDYCIEYNQTHGVSEGGKEKDTRRMATQGDWDAFFG